MVLTGNKHPRLAAGLLVAVILISALSYLGLAAILLGKLFELGGVSPRSGFGQHLSHGLLMTLYASSFFGIITTPSAIIVALVFTFLPVSGRPKIAIWLIVSGGCIVWLLVSKLLWGKPY